jgi:hypothetical protein
MPVPTAIHTTLGCASTSSTCALLANVPRFALVALIRKLKAADYSVVKHRRPFVMPPIFPSVAETADKEVAMAMFFFFMWSSE